MTIQIDHLHKSYGSGAEAHEVLHDINLTIDSGEVFGILGSSGAGKSTLVRCINLLERPTSGKVRVDGEDITDAKGKELADVRAGIGMIFQNFSLENLMRFVGKTFNLNTIILENQSTSFYQFISIIFLFIYIEVSISFMKSEGKIEISSIRQLIA